TIDTVTFPVTLIYDPPRMPSSTLTEAASELLIQKISDTVEKVLNNPDEEARGGILIFLPGEKIIKDCMRFLDHSHFSSRIFTLPLYGRLSKEDQERVFQEAPEGKKKIIISTNIAETSVTISDITTVIDSGLAKLNFYNPRTFTSSLIETPVSKASLNQRKGRAGRTQKGLCYRLYSIKDFETRQMYTTEEIYRTDLSEVVLQMADLGITDFMGFDFISHPGKEGIIGAIETLNMLGALSPDNSLSSIGKLMVNFPLEPRISRMIVEAIMKYPDVLEEVLIAASFLSTNSPFMLPPGEELEARKAHHRFQDIQGDFVSYLNLFKAFSNVQDKEKFAENNYLDLRILYEIDNINKQLQDIIYHMNIPVTGGGDKAHYLTCIASGMIQFVCIRSGKDTYRSLTTDKINIHPGSSMFRKDPLYIVAGEIVRTSRMFAMSVSPLTSSILRNLSPDLLLRLENRKKASKLEVLSEKYSAVLEKSKKRGSENTSDSKEVCLLDDMLIFGEEKFTIKKIKGRKTALLPVEKFSKAFEKAEEDEKNFNFKGLCGKIEYQKGFSLFEDIKLNQLFKFAENFPLTPLNENSWNRKQNVNINEKDAASKLCELSKKLLHVAVAKQKEKAYGLVALYTDGNGNYWPKISKGLHTAVNESLYSLEKLSETEELFTESQKEILNEVYRKLNEIL
ncbi:MAG: ATP-dependent RNA helicase, partial [Treponema sp.]|nr:ATP-dependent RNA helicase [Treponema sp.]